MLTDSSLRLRDQRTTTQLPPAVEMREVSVRYRVPREKLSSLKEFAIRWLQKRVEMMDIWAVRRVSLAIREGEIFGIIGRNGAGKTTLLKVLAGLLQPTEGRVLVRGSVAPLLDLGAGFHPELTGRENLFLYGPMLGKSKQEIKRAFDEIVDYAELGEFIDSPLRVYSSGMVARLGFSIATSRHADVLLIDEGLAVGDVHFQHKCLSRMQQFRDRGATIILVTQALDIVQSYCDRAAWMEAGKLLEVGPVRGVVDKFMRSQRFPINYMRPA